MPTDSKRFKSICFFNNKGGVGKTTLLCNIAAALSKHHALRVVVVDADPQCNATQLILGTEKATSLYRPSGKEKPSLVTTLETILRPLTIGESKIAPLQRPIEPKSNRFNVTLVPGHPRVSLLEDKLSQVWLQFSGGDVGGARQTNWGTQLSAKLAGSYDVALYDVGPSLGALNRSVLLGVDFFIAPMGCDVFSLFGLSNISQWLDQWISSYGRSIEACERTGAADDLKSYGVRTDASQAARFLGYTVQQYITKSKGGIRRPTVSFERIRKLIPTTIHNELAKFAAPGLSQKALELPDVPHMYSLVPLAQTAAAPVHDLTYADGLAGAQPQQKDEYTEFIKKLAAAILKNASLD